MKTPLDTLLDEEGEGSKPGVDFAEDVSRELGNVKNRANWLLAAKITVYVSTLFAVTGGLLAGSVYLIEGTVSFGASLALISVPIILAAVVGALWIHGLTR